MPELHGQFIIAKPNIVHPLSIFSIEPSTLQLIPASPSSSTATLYPAITSRDGLEAIMAADPAREHALEDYKNKLLESREWEAKLKALRLEIKGLQRDFDVSEDNIKALQSVGQIIGEVLKQLDEERCEQPRTASSLGSLH